MKIIIDGMECEAKRGEMLLQIAKRNNIFIPTLCHSEALPGLGNCRLCIVEVEEKGRKSIVASCIYPVRNEVTVYTHSDRINFMRKNLLMLLYARAPQDKVIDELRKEYGVPDNIKFRGDPDEHCILCGLCVKACEEMGSYAISTVMRGVTKKVSTPYDEPSNECIGCASCAYVCPTDAIKMTEVNGIRTIWDKDFQLIKCKRCGKPFAAKEQLEYNRKKLGENEFELYCENCKKVMLGEKLKEIYKNA